MSQRYTAAQKTEILSILQNNHGDIARTSLETGVPERTLREWRRLAWLKGELPPLPPQPTPQPRRRQEAQPLPEFSDLDDALKFLRENIMQEILRLSASFNDAFIMSTPYQRVLALTQLLDRLLKLDQRIPEEEDDKLPSFYYPVARWTPSSKPDTVATYQPPPLSEILDDSSSDGQLQDELRPVGAALHADQTPLSFHDRLDDGET